MTWSDVIRSVTARIHDGRAQDNELRAKWKEEHMPIAGRQRFDVEVHCASCGRDAVLITDVEYIDCATWYCMHCGADNPEIRDVRIHHEKNGPEHEALTR
jgi:hypothetical protein